jgi:hypothetical protein
MSFRSGYISSFFEFGFQRRKCFDDAYQIFVRTDAAGIEQERMRDLVALGEKLAITFGGMSMQEARINCVMDYFHAMGCDPKHFFNFILGEI